jgi:hypothetical protein
LRDAVQCLLRGEGAAGFFFHAPEHEQAAVGTAAMEAVEFRVFLRTGEAEGADDFALGRIGGGVVFFGFELVEESLPTTTVT